jgi:hypothetical protein
MARIAFRDPRFAPSLGACKPVGAALPNDPRSGDGRGGGAEEGAILKITNNQWVAPCSASPQ